MIKSTLIDSNAEMPTRRKQVVKTTGHRERLSEWTPRTGDAIVRTQLNMKTVKSAEMTDSLL